MRTHNIPSCYRKSKRFVFKPPDLALLSTLIGLNYPCLELIFTVLNVFEPLKFDCICLRKTGCLLKRDCHSDRFYCTCNFIVGFTVFSCL